MPHDVHEEDERSARGGLGTPHKWKEPDPQNPITRRDRSPHQDDDYPMPQPEKKPGGGGAEGPDFVEG